MTISIWRYSHLVLAVSCCLFLTVAASTGIILSFNAIQQQTTAKHVAATDTISLGQTIETLQSKYMQLSELGVDKYKQVTLKAIDDDGKELNLIIDPSTGKSIGKKEKKNEFIQTVTSLHRSLFLHDLGRIFIGITAFLLLLIALSGIMLIIQRQQGLQRFFAKIVKEYFSQYYHVALGRILLIPIVIIALTGSLMTMKRFHLLPEKNTTTKLNKATTDDSEEAKNIKDIAIFQKIKLIDVKSIEFPFSEDPEEHYTLKLSNKEMTIDQFSGNIITEVRYPFSEIMRQWSLVLHTGRSSIVWAIILGLAAIAILFFIYSGFVITFKRRAGKGKIENKYNEQDADIILLVGSESGNTFRFANAISKQLLANGKHPFVTEMNKYTSYPNAEHIILMTATFGMGDAPTNAGKFEQLLSEVDQLNKIKVSVVAFGSLAYPEFCAYGLKVASLVKDKEWADIILPTHTVNEQSTEEFSSWVKAWSETTEIPLVASTALYTDKPKEKQRFIVVEKKDSVAESEIFTLKLRLDSRHKYTSGDLLSVYPSKDLKERFYSIGKIDKDIQLAIRKIEGGLGSEYLHALEPGNIIEASIIDNEDFHFPTKATSVILIANGTGIAPFLGMITHNKEKIPTILYGGFRTQNVLNSLVGNQLENAKANGQLEKYTIAYSREDTKQYVTNLIENDLQNVFQLLQDGAIIMICGSLSMGHDVVALLEKHSVAYTGKDFQFFKENGQLKMDCY